MQSLRCITYLAPGIPRGLFEGIVDYLAGTLSLGASLRAESRWSGPPPEGDDPISLGEAEIGWMCTPSYLWARERPNPTMQLLPAAMVFDDPRNQGRPLYYSDVVVHRDSDARSFRDLQGGRWVYNDANSQSGYFNLLEELAGRGETLDFFRQVLASGSHHDSLLQVADRKADAAAIDSNVLVHLLAENSTLRESTRVLASWGPHAIQPMVASSQISAGLLEDIAEALLRMHEQSKGKETLDRFKVQRFQAIDDSLYFAERIALAAGEGMLMRCGCHPAIGSSAGSGTGIDKVRSVTRGAR